MEEKSLEQLQNEFIAKIAPYKQGVADEFLKRKNGYGEPQVVEGLQDSYLQTALRMIEIQKQKGYFAKKDLLPADFTKIQTTAKKFGETNKQAVARFITNDRYMSPETIEIESICNLIEDVFAVYQNHYEKLGAFPVNALSQASRDYLSNKKVKLGLSDKLGLLIGEYIPELAGMSIVDKSYKAVPRYKYKYNDEIARDLAIGLKQTYSDETGAVDNLFLESSKNDLTQLLAILHDRHITFEEFASKNGVNYTRCYKLDSAPTVLRMIQEYHKRAGTYQGITKNDPYLRQKIDTVERHSGVFNLKTFLDSYGITNDVFDNGQEITPDKLQQREIVLMNQLGKVYQNGQIEEGFLKKHPSLYEECLEVAKRRGYASVDAYLISHGFTRSKLYDKAISLPQIVLTERDLFYYGILSIEPDFSIEDAVKRYNIELADVENNKAYYQKLVAEKGDCTKIKNRAHQELGDN